MHERSEIPEEAEIRSLLGSAWSRYQRAQKGLAELGLEPEFYWYGQGEGWTVRFQTNRATTCALYLTSPPIALVTIGPKIEMALRSHPDIDNNLLQLIMATRAKEGRRWVQLPLRNQADVNRFLALMQAKMNLLNPPKGEKTEKSGTEKAARGTKSAAASRKRHRKTTSAVSDRSTAGKSPRRSTARRSSRG